MLFINIVRIFTDIGLQNGHEHAMGVAVFYFKSHFVLRTIAPIACNFLNNKFVCAVTEFVLNIQKAHLFTVVADKLKIYFRITWGNVREDFLEFGGGLIHIASNIVMLVPDGKYH